MGSARFVARMAWREMRAAWRRLVFFFLCLALGVGAIVTLRSVVSTVRSTLTREARALLGADLAISTSRPWDPAARTALDARLASAPVLARSEEIETLSMVRPAAATSVAPRLVELKGVQHTFPLYGRLTIEGVRPYSHDLLKDHGVLVRPELLVQLGLQVGDALLIGKTRFTVRGVVTAEPGRSAGGFSFGSRLFLDLDDLKRTGLLGFGSRANYAILLKLPEPSVAALARELRDRFRGRFVRVRTFQAAEDDIGRDLERAENYLSLVGLVMVVLGGLGVWSVVRVFLQQKLKSIAVLKCLGATSRQILWTYLAQVMGMAACGSLLGTLLARGAIAWVQPTLARATGIDVALVLTPSAIAQGTGIGLLVALLFSMVPLLDVRHVRASLLLRESADVAPRRDWARYAATGIVGGALVGLAAWQAGSWRIGGILAGGFAGIAIALLGAALLLVKAMAPLRRSRSFRVRYAARRIGRPGSQVRPVLLAVGLGAFLVLGVRLLQGTLLAEFQMTARPDMPDMFLIDVQPDQVEGVAAFLTRPAWGARHAPRLIPVLRARVTGIRGRRVNLDSYEEVRGRGSLGREYVITYRPRLERNERIVDGAFWPPSPSPAAEVSIERGLRDRQHIAVGDVVRFDVLGRAIEARVTSVREVDWSDARAGGFMFVFRPGTLDAAPQTFIAPVRGPVDSATRARMQRDLTAQFPNVSVVDVQEILATVGRVLASVTLAVSVVGMLVMASGVLILVGSISMTKFQRVYEAAILKTVGATTRDIAAMLAIEYGLLGTVAGTIGAAGALGLSWAVSTWAFEVPWRPSPVVVIAGIAVSAALVSGVGILASLDVLRRRPLATLRAE